MRRVLLVSYYFPPLAGSGVFRPLRLAKYLPRVGWDVSVVTVSTRVRVLKDEGLLGEVPPGTHVTRSATCEPRTLILGLNRLGLRRLARRIEPWLMVPDAQRGWVPFAVRAGLRRLSAVPHDAVVSTAGPYSSHLVGLGLKRRAGLPWVADFRDEWTTNPYLVGRYPTAWHRGLNRRLERAVLAGADRVVAVSEPWCESIHSVAPELARDKFAVLENGFDGEHFARTGETAPRDLFRIAYSGTFYGHRRPDVFLDAVRAALASGTIPRERLEIVFMGHGAPPAASDLADRLRVVGQRPYFESLRLLEEAALLLLVVPREGGRGNHTGKLFQYLAARRPILALAPEDNVAARLVRESGSGIVAPPDEAAAVAGALARCYEDWRSGRAPSGQDRARIARYEASRQAAEWAALLDGLARTSARSSTSRRETTSSA